MMFQSKSHVEIFPLTRIYQLLVAISLTSVSQVYGTCFYPIIFGNSPAPTSFIWPVFWIEKLSSSSKKAVFLSLFIVLMASAAMAILKSKNLYVRLIHFGVTFTCVSAIYSFGKTDHIFHSLLFTLFWFIFFSSAKLKSDAEFEENKTAQKVQSRIILDNESWDRWLLKIIKLNVTIFYSLAGFWKIKDSLYYLYYNGFESFNPLAVNINWLAIEMFLQPKGFWGISDPSWLWTLLIVTTWFGIGLLQMLPLVAVLLGRKEKEASIGILFFHSMTSIFMNIHFSPTPIVAFILLFFSSKEESV